MATPLTICVYCGANAGADPDFERTARALGAAIAERGDRLVYGGGRVGLMGTVADAAIAAGGEVIGIIPKDMVDREVGHSGLTELIQTDSMHERKANMERLADAFIALPGGFGTLDESMEMLTWNQIGYVQKPVVFLDVNEYWAPLFTFLDHAVGRGLLKPHHRAMAQYTTTVDAALTAASTPAPATVSKWSDATVSNAPSTDQT